MQRTPKFEIELASRYRKYSRRSTSPKSKRKKDKVNVCEVKNKR